VKIKWQIGLTLCFSLLLGCGNKEAYYKSVAHDLNATIRLQEEVDSGHNTGNLDPKDTAMRFLNESLNDPGPFEDVRVGKEKRGAFGYGCVLYGPAMSLSYFGQSALTPAEFSW